LEIPALLSFLKRHVWCCCCCCCQRCSVCLIHLWFWQLHEHKGKVPQSPLIWITIIFPIECLIYFWNTFKTSKIVFPRTECAYRECQLVARRPFPAHELLPTGSAKKEKKIIHETPYSTNLCFCCVERWWLI
jgi:hypothetical protein